MATFESKTLAMQAGTGYVVPFVPSVGIVSVLARAECFLYVAGPGITPATPSVTPAPSAGTVATYVHLIANEQAGWGTEPAYVNGLPVIQDPIGYLVVWAVATGDLVINSH